MAVEIYVAVGDPRRRAAMVTVRDREESVINECLDYAEMSKKLSILSAQLVTVIKFSNVVIKFTK